ncbi:MAG: hypothetical protein ACLP7P_12135 [Rhodomicrobium sp.]
MPIFGRLDAEFANLRRVPAFQAIEKQTYKRLDILDAATSLDDLRALRSNNLEVLKGGS